MTEIEQKKQNLALLADYQFFAIQEKYKGTMYKDISVKIQEKYNFDVTEQQIKNWFWKNGSLLPMYREYADIMVELELESARDFIKGNVSNAAKTLARVMAGKKQDGYNFGPAQVMAAKEFLDRGLGKVKEEVEHSGAVVVGVMDILRAKNELEKQNGQNTEDIKSV